jgi:hypothetical protein
MILIIAGKLRMMIFDFKSVEILFAAIGLTFEFNLEQIPMLY